MAYISYNKLWAKEFDNIVSKKDKVQDNDFNQIKLELNETYKKDEKRTTNFKYFDDSDFINKAYVDGTLPKTDGHLSILE